jgi:hypothetical protein
VELQQNEYEHRAKEKQDKGETDLISHQITALLVLGCEGHSNTAMKHTTQQHVLTMLVVDELGEVFPQ